jgi:hypothetical protein
VVGNFALIGSATGVHVFSLTDPANPAEISYMPSHGAVIDIAALSGIIYLADGRGITIATLNESGTLTEAKRVNISTLALAVGVNERDGKLVVLTPASLRVYELALDPLAPFEKRRLNMLGLSYLNLIVENRWTYLTGLWTKAVYDGGATGLSNMGPHSVAAWTDGRILRDGVAERVDWVENALEVWSE